jgi:hypothetical protein
MENWLRCNLSPGQFDGEFGVDGAQHDGKTFSLFAPKPSIKFDEEPTKEKVSPGWVKVQVLQQQENLVLVRLPRQTFQSGYFVTVNSSQLEHPLPARKAATAHRRNGRR